LYAVLFEKMPKEETLQTFLVEIEQYDLNYDKNSTRNHILLDEKYIKTTPGHFCVVQYWIDG
jgi:hypothetical protein